MDKIQLKKSTNNYFDLSYYFNQNDVRVMIGRVDNLNWVFIFLL